MVYGTTVGVHVTSAASCKVHEACQQWVGLCLDQSLLHAYAGSIGPYHFGILSVGRASIDIRLIGEVDASRRMAVSTVLICLRSSVHTVENPNV